MTPSSVTATSTPAHGAESTSRERVLAVAEQMFGDGGFAAVSLRDIARQLDIKPASLYYHFPGGKEDMFAAVMERLMARNEAGMQATLDATPQDIRSQLQAAAAWLAGQPPLDLTRMMRSDMPALDKAHQARLMAVASRGLFGPLQEALERADERGEIDLRVHSMLIAGSFLVMVNATHDAERYAGQTRSAMAAQIADVLLDGLAPREPARRQV